jgi:very-short-patch-repair endonuclease
MPADWRISPNSSALSAIRGWGAAAELAGRQHGVVSLAQLEERGVRAGTVRYWVETRRLARLYAGVYAVGHAALRPEGHRLAAVLACGDDAVLSHASAAAHWGIRQSAAAVIDVTAPGRAGRARTGLRIHCGARLGLDEVTVEDGVPCTTVARTLLDLAAVADPASLSRAIEAAERLELFDLRPLRVLIGRHTGRRGIRRLRGALATFDPDFLRVKSELEARFLQLCIDRLPERPRVNETIEAGGEGFEVDFSWPRARLIVETDGAGFHDTTAASARDAHRDRILTAAGWTVIRCRWHDVVTNPDPLIARVRARIVPPAGRLAYFAE